MGKSTKEKAKTEDGTEETWKSLCVFCNHWNYVLLQGCSYRARVFVRSQEEDLHRETTVRDTSSPLVSDCRSFQACCYKWQKQPSPSALSPWERRQSSLTREVSHQPPWKEACDWVGFKDTRKGSLAAFWPWPATVCLSFLISKTRGLEFLSSFHSP